jgi:hypothetical protein
MDTAAVIWVAEGTAITTAGAEAADITMGAITDPIFTGTALAIPLPRRNRIPDNNRSRAGAAGFF